MVYGEHVLSITEEKEGRRQQRTERGVNMLSLFCGPF